MIFLVLLLGFGLRLVNLNQSFWLDEAIGAISARDFSYYGIVFDFLKKDNHPPLYYLTLKFWSWLFGFSEISLRSLSIIFGVLTIYLVYLICKKIKIRYSERFALLTSLFIATSPLLVYYSQEVRMYPMITMLSAAMVYLFILINEKNTFLKWSFFSFLLVILLATDYIAIFLIPVFGIYLLAFKRRKKFILNFCLSLIPLLLVGIFWLPIYLEQAKGGAWLLQILPSWRNLSGGANVKELILVWSKFIWGRISFNNKNFYFGIIILSSIPFLISLYKSFKERNGVKLVWLWLMVPLILGFLISFIIPAFVYFRFIYVLPSLYILTGFGIISFGNGTIRRILILMVMVVNISGLLVYYFDSSQQREDWKGAINYVRDNSQNGDISIFEFPEPFAPFRFYAPELIGMGVTDSISANPGITRRLIEKTVQNRNKLFYFDYLKDLSDPGGIVQKTLIDQKFKEIGAKSFNGVGKVTIFERVR